MDRRAEPVKKPMLLCLTPGGGLDGWIGRLSALDAFLIVGADDLSGAAQTARSCRPDLIVLDRTGLGRLPADFRSGYAEQPIGRLPVVLLEDRIATPETPRGPADDLDAVLAKTTTAEEVSIRLRAVLRRRRPTALRATMTFGPIELRQDQRIVLARDRPVHLPRDEFNLLALLLEAPDSVWTRDTLRDCLWSPQVRVGDAAVDKIVRGLRRSLMAALGSDPIARIRANGIRLILDRGQGIP